VFVGSTEVKVYTVCWWSELREMCIEFVGGQNRGKGLYSVLVGSIEGKVF